MARVRLPRGAEAVSLLATYALVLQYKSTPGKKVSVVGWMVQLPDDPEHPDIFQLNNPDKGRRGPGAGRLQLLAAPCPLLLDAHCGTAGTSVVAALSWL